MTHPLKKDSENEVTMNSGKYKISSMPTNTAVVEDWNSNYDSTVPGLKLTK